MHNKRLTLLELLAVSFMFITIAAGSLIIIDNGFKGGLERITGNVLATVNVTPSLPAACNTTITPGWNLKSFYCISTYEDLQIMRTELSNPQIMYAYRSFDSKDPWKVYNKELPEWVVNDLTYMTRVDAYWIYSTSNEPFEFYYEGLKRIPTTINLRTGWNLVGYPTDNSRDVALSFETIENNLGLAYYFNQTSGQYQNYSLNGNGTLNKTIPYGGYWIMMNNSDNWVVNW